MSTIKYWEFCLKLIISTLYVARMGTIGTWNATNTPRPFVPPPPLCFLFCYSCFPLRPPPGPVPQGSSPSGKTTSSRSCTPGRSLISNGPCCSPGIFRSIPRASPPPFSANAPVVASTFGCHPNPMVLLSNARLMGWWHHRGGPLLVLAFLGELWFDFLWRSCFFDKVVCLLVLGTLQVPPGRSGGVGCRRPPTPLPLFLLTRSLRQATRAPKSGPV